MDPTITIAATENVVMVGASTAARLWPKKSKHGIATPHADIELIKRRLKQAVEISQGATSRSS